MLQLNEVVPEHPLFDEHRSLEFVVKISERCNIACTYCYFFFRGDDSYKEHPPFITNTATQEFLAMLRRLAAQSGLRRVRIGLHGGEPLMASKRRVREFCSSVKELERQGILESVAFSLQTNAVLVDDGWLDVFEEFEIGVGVSLDGTKAINDTYRLDKKGRGTYDRAVAGFKHIRDASRERYILEPGLLGVINTAMSAREAFMHHHATVGARSMNFLLPDFTHEDDIELGAVEKMEEFLIELFRAWTANRDTAIHVRLIDEIIAPLASDEDAQRYKKYHRDYRHIFTLSSDGSVGPEDTIKPLDVRYRSIGHCSDISSVEDLLDHPVMLAIDAARDLRPQACADCDWWGICRGSNISNRYSAEAGFDNASIYCTALKSLYLEVASWMIEQGVDIKDIQRRLHLSSQGPAH